MLKKVFESSNLNNIAHYPAPTRLGIFLLSLLLLWLPIAVPIYWLIQDKNLASLLTMPLLYGEFILLVQFWGKYIYKQSQLLKDYGLEITRRNGRDILTGLSFGLLLTMSLFTLEGLLGWLAWLKPVAFLPRVILEGLLVALGIGFAEELLFRGWLLDELQRDYRLVSALWVDSLLYALLHFIKPLPEILRTSPAFPGLVLLGLTMVWAKRAQRNRLGLPIGLHAGLVWGYYIINVGQLVKYSGQVPEWVIGIDHNPLAGLVGLLVLGVVAFWLRRNKSYLN